MNEVTLATLTDEQTKEAMLNTHMGIIFAGRNAPEGRALLTAAHGKTESYIFFRNIDLTVSAWKITGGNDAVRRAMAENAKKVMIEKGATAL